MVNSLLVIITLLQAVAIAYLVYKYVTPYQKLMKDDEKLNASIMAEIVQMEKNAPEQSKSCIICPKCGKKICDPIDPCYCWIPTGKELDDLLDDDLEDF